LYYNAKEINTVGALLSFEEVREPNGRGLEVPCQPIFVVDIDQTKLLGVSLGPLKVVQEGPYKVCPTINTIPVPVQFQINGMHLNICQIELDCIYIYIYREREREIG
jgi:hypothetical protein